MDQQITINRPKTTSETILFNMAIISLYVIVAWSIIYIGRSGELRISNSGSSDYMYSGTQAADEWLSYNKIKVFGSNIILYGWMIHIFIILVIGIIKKTKHSKFSPFILSAFVVFSIEIVVFIFTFITCNSYGCI